jgi:hypothetical protein
MLYHASLKLWADVADQLSMFMFVAFLCSYSAVQLWQACKNALGVTTTDGGNVAEKIGWGILFFAYRIFQMVVTRGGHHPSSSAIALFVGFALILQLAFVLTKSAFGKFFPYHAAGAVFFVAGCVAFAFANIFHNNEAPGQSNCLVGNAIFYPQSFLQAHALWQLLAAVMTFCLYIFQVRKELHIAHNRARTAQPRFLIQQIRPAICA